jgi:hypothetical protein
MSWPLRNLNRNTRAIAAARDSDDVVEGRTAFLEKRPATFGGH